MHAHCNKAQIKALFLSIGNKQIENVEVQKLLGIYVDNTLSWSHQVSHVRKNVNSKIALLKRVPYYLTHDMKLCFTMHIFNL